MKPKALNLGKITQNIMEATDAAKPAINAGIFCDMHVHSQNSHDSESPVADTAKACLKNGVSAFAVTDHCDIQYYGKQDIPALVDASVAEAAAAAEKFEGMVQILKGIELGESIWNVPRALEIINRHDYDVVLGSVHAVRYKSCTMAYSTIDFSQMPAEELDAYLGRYFDEVLEMLQTIPCDVMAHLTCPLRYINGKYRRNADVTKYEEKIRRILRYIIDNRIAMEINTSGIGTAFGDFMPDTHIIQLFKEMGGYLVTLGSDAHISQNVGNGFDAAIRILRKYGFKNYYYYKNRKNIPCNIERGQL